MEKRNQKISEFRQMVVGSVIICITASVIGLLFNMVNPNRIPLDYKKIADPTATVSDDNGFCEPVPTFSEDAFDLLNAGEVTYFIDTREKDEFATGHIKGALNIPSEKAYPVYQSLKFKLPKDGVYIFYCDEGCDSSMEVAYFFCQNGFTDGNIRVLDDGFEYWKEEGYPVE